MKSRRMSWGGSVVGVIIGQITMAGVYVFSRRKARRRLEDSMIARRQGPQMRSGRYSGQTYRQNNRPSPVGLRSVGSIQNLSNGAGPVTPGWLCGQDV